ncbi:MAG: LacI family DNA-binding transcriptional regulator [Thermomicrobiales bacterium]
MAKSGRRPTQIDVARQAGVSQALVSYVFTPNARASVPASTRQRVLDVADQLGYVPNRAARHLRMQRTHTLVCIIPDITNPFYPRFARGIQDVAEAHDYDLVMRNTDGRLENEARCLRSVLQGGADGVIGVFFHTTATELAELLARQIPVVRLEPIPKPPGPLPLDNLCVDNVAAARSAVALLIARGHRRIAMISGRAGPFAARLRGYRDALAGGGLAFDEDLVEYGDFREEGGYGAMQALLAKPVTPTAVFAANDEMAMGALRALAEAGRRVPDDVAVVGFDDIPVARLTSPPLTTVAQFPDRLGRRAAEMLLERLRGEAPAGGRGEEIPFELVIRGSA